MTLKVIAWYLDEIGNDIETEDELIEQKQVIEKVVDKLIYQDQVNWKTGGRGEMIEHCHRKLASATEARLMLHLVQVIVPLSNTAKGSAEEDPFLVVHPNYCYSDA